MEQVDDSDGVRSSGAVRKRIKRRRPALSCTQCAERKVKCDRKVPCTNCRHRSGLVRCSLLPAGAGTSSNQSAGYMEDHVDALLTLETLHARLRRLESIVLPRSGPDSDCRSVDDEAGDQQSETEDAVLALEDMASGVSHARIGRRTGLPDMVPDSRAAPVSLSIDQQTGYQDHGTTDYGSMEPQQLVESIFGSSVNAPYQDVLEDVLRQLPPAQAIIVKLAELYFDRVSWSWPVLYRHTFLHELNEFTSRSFAGQRLVDPLWLANLCSVLALATACIETIPDQIAPHFSPMDWMEAPARYHGAARAALDCGDWMTRPSPRSISAVGLFGHYLLFSGLSRSTDTLSVYLSVSIRHCQTLGWLKLGMGSRDASAAPSHSATQQAHLRLLYTVVSMDQMMFRFRPMLPLEAVTSPLPSNYNDEEFALRPMPMPKPAKVLTDATYEILRYRVARISRQFHDTVIQNPAFIYEDVMAVDAALRALLEEHDLESPGKDETPMRAWARLQANQQIHMRLMRIHRPFMSTGYRDAKYRQSMKTAFDSAKILLQLERLLNGAGAPRTRGCFQIIHIQTAIVVICLDAWQCFGTGAASTTTRHHETLLRDAVDMLRDVVDSCRGEIRRVARQTCLIAGALLEALDDRREKRNQPSDYAALLRRIADLLRRVEGTHEGARLVQDYLAGSSPSLLGQGAVTVRDDPLPVDPGTIDSSWMRLDDNETDFFTGSFFGPSSTMPATGDQLSPQDLSMLEDLWRYHV